MYVTGTIKLTAFGASVVWEKVFRQACAIVWLDPDDASRHTMLRGDSGKCCAAAQVWICFAVRHARLLGHAGLLCDNGRVTDAASQQDPLLLLPLGGNADLLLRRLL
jgi:hypothetical protein